MLLEQHRRRPVSCLQFACYGEPHDAAADDGVREVGIAVAAAGEVSCWDSARERPERAHGR